MIRAVQMRAARKRYKEMAPILDEQSRRRFAALEAQALWRGGISFMAQINGLARRRVYRAFPDIRNNYSAEPGRRRTHSTPSQVRGHLISITLNVSIAAGSRPRKVTNEPTLQKLCS